MYRKVVPEEVLNYDKEFIRQMMTPLSTNARQIRILKKALWDVINEELTDRQKQLIMMRYFQSMTNSQIARELHLNPSTVGRTLKRAEYNIYRTLRFFLESPDPWETED